MIRYYRANPIFTPRGCYECKSPGPVHARWCPDYGVPFPGAPPPAPVAPPAQAPAPVPTGPPNLDDWKDLANSISACSDDVYIFQAALICGDCAIDVMTSLTKTGNAPLVDNCGNCGARQVRPTVQPLPPGTRGYYPLCSKCGSADVEFDERTFDSDDFPKEAPDAGGESDSVEHCDLGEDCANAIGLPDGTKVGCWLGNSLTSDGVDYVCGAVKEWLSTGRGRVAPLWYWWYRDELSDCDLGLDDDEEDPPGLEDFVRGYLTTMLWSTMDSAGNPLEDNFDVDDIDPASVEKAREECAEFMVANEADLAEANNQGSDDERNGHDFWLTRNRHGAGYWDRGYGAAGERLMDAAHAYGSVDPYVGDDAKVYLP